MTLPRGSIIALITQRHGTRSIGNVLIEVEQVFGVQRHTRAFQEFGFLGQTGNALEIGKDDQPDPGQGIEMKVA